MTLCHFPCPALLAGLVLIATVRPAEAPTEIGIPVTENFLTRLRPEHPRLIATASDFATLRVRLGEDSTLGDWFKKLKTDGDRMLTTEPSKYEIPDGLRLLSTSRRVLNRVQTLGLLRHLTGDINYTGRAWKELQAAAAFPDWNPRHFLDTAEMTHAFAIGYDWLYHDWIASERDTLRVAMIEKGIKPALELYRKNSGWTRARHNWNQVCNGGIGIGALALADVEPALAAEVLRGAVKSIQLPMHEFAPDGAWAEGPGYWNYATTYNCDFLAALETALGTDFGLGTMPGFAQAGMFPIYLTGPLGRTFNYADGGDSPIRAPHLFWMARRFKLQVYAAYQRAVASAHPLDLVWWRKEFQTTAHDTLPLDKHFRVADIVTFRGDWNDPQTSFVGFKGGDNKANHSNLDLGSFVLDALGVRWVVDLGADDYNLPGYFGKQRWTYYRLRAESHNTLVLNPGTEPDQDPAAAAPISNFASQPDRAFAIADLSAAYAKHAQSVRRGLAMFDRRRQVLVQDEVRADRPAEVWWFLHTPAQVTVSDDGQSALLSLDGRRLQARLLGPAAARFTVRDAKPLPSSPQPEKQNPNCGIRKLAVQLREVRDLRLTVLLTPLKDDTSLSLSAPEVRPLAQWLQ